MLLQISDLKNNMPNLDFQIFGKKVQQLSDLQQAISQYASTAAAKLRKQNSVVKTIVVFIQTSRFVNDAYSSSTTIQPSRPSSLMDEHSLLASDLSSKGPIRNLYHVPKLPRFSCFIRFLCELLFLFSNVL